MPTPASHTPVPDLHPSAGATVWYEDARSTNLQVMQVVRLGLERDLPGTCLRFGLDADLGRQLLALTPAELSARVASIGNRSLFVPRQDFLDLLQAPDALRATLAVARRAVPSNDMPN
ncbi:MAG TPA: hypothetical protein VMS38_30600 [Pseudorhodoferax sp.]|nr:hypothetical protein [Pseudorhodoferax sp.]